MKSSAVVALLLAFVAVCTASACTSSHQYATSAESGHFGCDSYGDRLQISWLIQLNSEDKKIALTFHSFDTEANYDFVRIYDGSSDSANLMGSYSGSVIPGPFSSSGNALFIVFTADEYVEGDGFTASWTTYTVAEGITPCNANEHLSLEGDSGDFGCSGYANSLDTSWHIQGNNGERVVVHFDTFDTEREYDVVTVYDGSDANANVIGTFSGSDVPPPVTATGSEVYVRFQTDYSLTATGFTASWSSLVQFADPCYNNTNKILLPREGYVGCPYGYGNNVNSTWLINVIGNYIVRLDFLTLGLETNVDYVAVYDGVSTEAPLLGRFTGNETPDPVTASGNRMLITLNTDSQNVASGFTATYQSVHALQQGGCSRSGTFVITDAQDSVGCNGYLGGVTEEWHLMAKSPEEVINLTWQSFDISQGDTVFVYNGNTTSSPLLYSVTGNEIPDPAVSTGEWMLVKFVANNDGVQGSGFAAIFESVSVDNETPGSCQSNHHYSLSSPSGVFGCDGYANAVTTTWAITVENGFIILVDWNTFFTEVLSDTVTIYDGPDENSEPLGSWSGAFRPPSVSSSSNMLYVKFSSDDTIVRSGFMAEYSSVFSGSDDTNSCFSSKSNILSGNEGTLGCDGYGGGVEVSWAITSESGTTISLDFISFQTEFNYDILRIYDGPSASSSQLAAFSGYVLPEPVHTTSNQMYLVFTSDEAVQYDGFRAEYHATEEASSVRACTATVHEQYTAPSGQFGCNQYGNDLDSSWLISLDNGQRITIQFSLLSTELYYDYVKVYDGTGTHSPLLGTYSGDIIPPALTSTGSSLYITFHSDTSVSSTYEGFIIQYVSFGSFEDNCNTSADYRIDSPSGSFGCDGYTGSITVTWSISSYGNIFLNFDQFSTELNYDIVYIYDGTNENAPLIAQYSGSDAPPISSTGNNLFVKFASDQSINRTGFSASFATIIIDLAPPRDE